MVRPAACGYNGRMNYRDQIEELLSANGWDGKFILEVLPGPPGSPQVVRVTMKEPHPAEPSGLVNEYNEALNPLEQVQQECLRALRTGRVGA